MYQDPTAQEAYEEAQAYREIAQDLSGEMQKRYLKAAGILERTAKGHQIDADGEAVVAEGYAKCDRDKVVLNNIGMVLDRIETMQANDQKVPDGLFRLIQSMLHPDKPDD